MEADVAGEAADGLVEEVRVPEVGEPELVARRARGRCGEERRGVAARGRACLPAEEQDAARAVRALGADEQRRLLERADGPGDQDRKRCLPFAAERRAGRTVDRIERHHRAERGLREGGHHRELPAERVSGDG